MVLKDYIKIISAIALLIITVILFSCEDNGPLLINCSKCTTSEPGQATIEIKLSTEYGLTIIKIYEGNLEDSVLYNTIVTKDNSTSCMLTMDKKYTFTAKYSTENGHYYFAVNSITPHVKYIPDQCDKPCYYVYDNTVNLRLKYTK